MFREKKVKSTKFVKYLLKCNRISWKNSFDLRWCICLSELSKFQIFYKKLVFPKKNSEKALSSTDFVNLVLLSSPNKSKLSTNYVCSEHLFFLCSSGYDQRKQLCKSSEEKIGRVFLRFLNPVHSKNRQTKASKPSILIYFK